VQVSADGHIMTLLVSTRDTYVAVINLKTNRIVHELQVSGCDAIHHSPNCDFLCTSSVHEAVREVNVFVIKTMTHGL